jgi:4-hydroxybenzoate polyprenyltransferase
LLRPDQWVKNAFVLAPLIFSRAFLDGDSIRRELLAAAVFCLASSAAYIVNDLFDADADRNHPEKRRRPIAAGDIRTRDALILLSFILLLAGTGVAALPVIAPGIGAYLALALLYSWFLKHHAWLDIAALALAFVLRVQTGILAIGAWASPWMLSASAFLALYLAVVKRREELGRVGTLARPGLRRYTVRQLDIAKALAIGASVASYVAFVAAVRPAMLPTIVFVLAGIARFEWRTRNTGLESAADVVLGDPVLAACLLAWAALSAIALV